MARLDAAIEVLLKNHGTELVFETGSSAYLRTPQGTRPIIKQPLTASQVVGAFAEIVPIEMQETYPAEGTTDFAYRSPAGGVFVRIEKQGEVVRAVVQPAADDAIPEPTTSAELISRSVPLSPQERTGPQQTPAGWGASAIKPAGEPRAYSRTGDARELMNRLLAFMLEKQASDLHLASGSPPSVRVDGDIRSCPDLGTLERDRLHEILFSIAPDRNRTEWEETKDTDFAHETSAARFRVNIFEDRNGIGAVLRQIPARIITAEEMGLPPAILEMCRLTKGLVVVTGPTGSGKSTTLAAMVDYINRTREDHIITIEDPVEFVHPNKKCIVNQREIGVNTKGFKQALRSALREDPDIVLVGEMRDLETVAIAIETAETGHLVFATLHTNTAASTVDRIIDQFPSDRQQQIRLMLSESLRGVVAQMLCKKVGGGRVPALEVLVCTQAINNLIREGKTFQIPSVLQTGRGLGMCTMNDSLFDLVKRRLIQPSEAYLRSLSKPELKATMERAGFMLEAA